MRKSRASMIEETRAKLIEAAREAFGSQGYSQASMDELTAKAGLTRGALYHHFGGKPGLLAAVVAQMDAEMDARLEQVLADHATAPADIHVVYPQRHAATQRVQRFVEHLARHFDTAAPGF